MEQGRYRASGWAGMRRAECAHDVDWQFRAVCQNCSKKQHAAYQQEPGEQGHEYEPATAIWKTAEGNWRAMARDGKRRERNLCQTSRHSSGCGDERCRKMPARLGAGGEEPPVHVAADVCSFDKSPRQRDGTHSGEENADACWEYDRDGWRGRCAGWRPRIRGRPQSKRCDEGGTGATGAKMQGMSQRPPSAGLCSARW